MEPSAFWDCTPREVGLILDGARMRMDREYEALAWSAWHSAFLARVDKFPSYRDFSDMIKPAKPVKVSPAQADAMAKEFWIMRGGDPAEWDRAAAAAKERRNG